MGTVAQLDLSRICLINIAMMSMILKEAMLHPTDTHLMSVTELNKHRNPHVFTFVNIEVVFISHYKIQKSNLPTRSTIPSTKSHFYSFQQQQGLLL